MDRHRDGTATSATDGAEDLSFRAFSAARERYFARLRADTEIGRLERIFHSPPAVRTPRQAPGGPAHDAEEPADGPRLSSRTAKGHAGGVRTPAGRSRPHPASSLESASSAAETRAHHALSHREHQQRHADRAREHGGPSSSSGQQLGLVEGLLPLTRVLLPLVSSLADDTLQP